MLNIGPREGTFSLEQVKVKTMNCFFSQISQVSIDTQADAHIQPNLLNCNVTYDAQSILIITKGGNQFYLPLDQQIIRVFPMIQGILIQFQVKAQSKLKQILYYQKNRNNGEMEIEEPQQYRNYSSYCYATITRHPLNPIKLLGQLSHSNLSGSQNQILNSWYKSKEKIMKPISQAPLLISYNQQLRRNAISLILVNNAELQQENRKAYLPTHTYSLKQILPQPQGMMNSGKFSESLGHYELLTYTIYQSNEYEPEIVQAIAQKSNKTGTIFLYTVDRYNTIKIYEITNIGYNRKNTSMTNIIHCVKKIDGGITLNQFNLYQKKYLVMEPYQCYQDQDYNHSIHSHKMIPIDLQIVYESLKSLNQCVVVLENKSKSTNLGYYNRGQKIWEEQLNKNIDELLPNSREALKIQNDKIYQYNIDNGKSKQIMLIKPLFENSFDVLIARNMQITLQSPKHFSIFVTRYKNRQNLIKILIDMQNAGIKVLHSLHQLYEQTKLYGTLTKERQKLGCVLMKLCLQLKKTLHIDYYLREGIAIQNSKIDTPILNTNEQQPFSIYQLLNRIIMKSPQIPKYPITCIYRRTGFIINFISLIINGELIVSAESWNKSLHLHIGSSHQSTTKQMFPLYSKKVYHLEFFDIIRSQKSPMPPKICTPSQKAFLYLIKHNQTPKDILSYSLSIRAIIHHLLSETKQSLPPQLYKIIPKLGFTLLSREDLYKNLKLYTDTMNTPVPFYLQRPSFNNHIKTLVQSSTSQDYFLTSNTPEINKLNHDLIFEEVDMLLSTISEIKIRIKDVQSIPDHKWQVQGQNILMKFANRKVSSVIGQGAFMIGTSRSFITDIIKIPKINIVGIMPNDIKIILDLKEDKQSLLYWPEFHSGMVAGLKLSRHVIPLSQDHLKTWIFYQKPDNPKRDHSGFLLSLGLLGYLKCFSPTDIYQYLKPNNQFTSVAILLGCSASKIGKSDQSLSKTLILHIPVLLPLGVDLQIPINVQTSALIGIGLLHKGTCNRTMTQMTLSQIGKKPCTDKCLDRQGYSLAAGWALGMICLGSKGAKDSFRDLRLQERLIRFIEGGKIMQPPQSMMSTNFLNDTKSSSIKEGPNVNLHITAPAALLAISLMYLKSNNSELAQKITLPSSFSTLQSCNPNHILLKTIAKNLIMWESIKNTQAYIYSQIPELIKFIYESTLKQVHQQYYLIYNVSQIDYQTVTSIYIGVVTGAIVSMAFKYAGTGDEEALKIIKNHIQVLKSHKIIKCEFANDVSNKNCIDQYQLYCLLSVSILAMGIVMAGSCDISCLNIIKSVRRKFQDSKLYHYGFNMAINMAIGFLFMGYGNYTFNRSSMAIASLLISIYPQFPNTPTDNKYHLQALRHFYVLALQQKIFHAVDVDTNKVISVKTQMRMAVGDKGEEKTMVQTHHTPVLLQENKKLQHIRIMDEDYFDVDFEFNQKIDKDDSKNIKAIYVKRKAYRDVSQQLLNPENALSTQNIRQSILSGLKDEPRYQMLVQKREKTKIDLSYLTGKKTIGTIKSLQHLQEKQKKIRQTYQNLYFQMLKQDKLELLEIYMNLSHQLQHQINHPYSPLSSTCLHHNIQTILMFQKYAIKSISFNKIISPMIQKFVQSNVQKEQDKLKKYYIHGQLNENLNSIDIYSFYQSLALLRIPRLNYLSIIEKAVKVYKSRKNNQTGKQQLQILLYNNYKQCDFSVLSKMLNIMWGTN